MSLLGLLCILLTGTATYSQTPLELDVGKQPIALADRGEYWIDSRTDRTANEVDTSNTVAWAASPPRGIYPLQAGQVLWVRFTLMPAPDAERWVLEIPYAAVDRASLYSQDRSGQFIEQRAGDLIPVNQWPIAHRHPLLPLRLDPQEPSRFLLRIENALGFSAPIRFVTSRQVLRDEQQNSIFLGVYFGVAALGMLAGLILYAWLRDWNYLCFSATSALVGLTLAALSGAAALHLWPNSPWWADHSLSIFGLWMLMSGMFLNARLVCIAQRSRPAHILVLVIVAIGFLLSLMLATTPSTMRLALVLPYTIFGPAVLVTINFWAWRRGDRYAGWLLLALTPLSGTWTVAAARYIGWLPANVLIDPVLSASMVLVLPIFLTALIFRSQQSLHNRSRVTGLDRIDPATGLLNEHVFGVRLLRMTARSERLGHSSAVMLIDLVNIGQVQRDFGRKAAEQLPVRVASRLLSTIRDIDSAARLSERRFGILVEGPISPQEAASLGPRIIARCLMPLSGMHAECVAQVRVAYALVPHQLLAGQSLLSRLDGRLTAAQVADDKRAIFTL